MAGPLIIDVPNEINVALLDSLVGHACAQPMLDDAAVGYLETIGRASGTGQNTGLRIEQYRDMVNNLTFYGADAVNGEPLPFDSCDATPIPWSLQVPYITLGYRALLRGYVASMVEGNLAADVNYTWSDGAGSRDTLATRGGYIGALLRVMGVEPGSDPTMHYTYAVAHGKRPTTDANWYYHPGKIDPITATPGTPSPRNGTSGDQIRLVTFGGPPTWTILLQRWVVSTWQMLYTTSDNLQSQQSPGYESYMGIVMELIAGGAAVQSAPPTGDPDQPVWFNRLELAQFEPWVIDKSSWGYREWDRHWEWLSGPYTSYFIPRRRPVMDLQHVPMSLTGAPTALRYSDPDIGVCVEFNRATWLFAAPPWDMTGMLYTTGGLVHAAVCDEGSYGYQAPFAMLGRFRFRYMTTWETTRIIMGAGEIWAASPGTANGMGLQWEPSGGGVGKLVARAYDTTASQWVTTEYAFDADDYDNRPVDIAFAWSGSRGATIGRPNYELRIVIDGITVASTTNEDIRLLGSKNITIGTYQGAQPTPAQHSFEGLLREAMAFGDAVTDADLREAFATVPALDNPSFEIADGSGRPGEAAGWLWHSVQQVGGWAPFNTYRADLEQWWTAQEEFGAGFRFPYTWNYADAMERLAATGFVATDVGKTAWQRDDDSYWKLDNHSPITWSELDIETNEHWASTLDALTTVVAQFNIGSTFEGTKEEFDQWVFASYTGIPWLDAYTLTAPWQDDVGFDGWYDADTGTSLYPLPVDAFGEGWGTDPLSTVAGVRWASGNCPGGILRGNPLTFPLTIRPSQARLILYADYRQVYVVNLTDGIYATASALATMIQAAWALVRESGIGLSFSSWEDGNESGIAFGWNGDPTTIMVMFGALASDRHHDARAVLGLSTLGPAGQMGRLVMPASVIDVQPSWVDAEDEYWLDVWSTTEFYTEIDPYITGEMVIEYGWESAIFDGETLRERNTLPGWFGAGAAWKSNYDPADLTSAMFDTGLNSVEHFPSANWPDEGYPF
jgi:hypothetical protein